MSFNFLIPTFLSCHSNVYFKLFGLKTNWSCITSTILAIVILSVILFIYFFLSRQDSNLDTRQSARKFENTSTRTLWFLKSSKNSPTVIEEINQSLKPESKIKGLADGQLVDENLSHLLIHDWIDGNASTGFSLRAPNGKSIPIYSKWTATDLLDRLRHVTDKTRQDDLKKQIRKEVEDRATEALKFLDKDRTLGFCILAVPDSVFGLCLDMQGRLAAANIVLISHNLLVPYVLLTSNLFLKDAKSAQGLQTSQVLNSSVELTEIIQKYVKTEVRPSIDTVRLQQSQHIRNNEQLKQVHHRLTQIQVAINSLHNMLPNEVTPLDNENLASIPQRLKILLNQLREGLLDGSSKASSKSNPDSESK